MSKSKDIMFGRYEVIGELGRGSMGVVYKARDPVIGRMVAIKSIPETFGLVNGKREEFIKRLRQEAITAGRLSHPNIVTTFDVGDTEHGPFIAMEYLDGVTLRDVITAGKRISFLQLHDITSQVADGLDYAHSRAIIHRDIKPANIMIVADNRVKIMDLGIARLPMSDLTKEGKLVGSPSYMSPEQLAGRTIDGRSDLFSLGVCIYQLMAFKKPFPGENINEICYKIVNDDFLPLSHHNPQISSEFDDFMMIAMAKDPDDRFQTGRELADALSVILEISAGETQTAPAGEHSASTGVIEEQSRGNYSEASLESNPNLTQTSNIDDIFKDLTHTARTVDLSRQKSGGSYWWLIMVGGAIFLALIILILFMGG